MGGPFDKLISKSEETINQIKRGIIKMFTKTAINIMNSERVGAQTADRRGLTTQTNPLTHIFPGLTTLTHFCGPTNFYCRRTLPLFVAFFLTQMTLCSKGKT